jgi:predicted nucleotidyltransferase
MIANDQELHGRQQVIETLRAQRPLLHARFGVARLALFGSVARDEGILGSDVDLLVEFDRPVGMFGFLELQNHLESLLGCSVDLGTLRSLKRGSRDRVLAEAVEIR